MLTAHRPARSLLAATLIASSVLLASGCAAAPAASPTPTAAPPVAIDRPAASEGELSDELQAKLQGALEATMAEYELPGAAAGVWIPGEGSWTAGAGFAGLEEDLAATTDLQWPIRSITKSYTVTLLLQLVDEGKVSLDDTIDQYLDGVTDGDTITLRQLADMSSGNSDYTNAAFGEDFEKDEAKIYTLDELNAFALGMPAQFAAGTEKVYTNSNINFLGAVVEKVTGQPFAEVLKERILDLLEQSGTQYITDVAEWADPHPTGYFVIDGVPDPQTENASILGAAGSMFSTLDDTRVWAEVLATGALLQPGTQEERQAGAPLDAGPPYDIYALGMGETEGWWGHNDEGIGFTAAAFHNNETGATIVVFMNESNVENGDHPADQTFRAFAEILAAGE